MNPSAPGGNPNQSINICRSCHQYPCIDQNILCSSCIAKATESMYSTQGINHNLPNLSHPTNQPNLNANAGPNNPAQGQAPNLQNLPGGGPAGNANFFPFFSSLEGVSEQDFNNSVFSEAGNLNFLGQNFASAVPPNFGNINNSSSPNISSHEPENSQQPSDSARFSSPPYEEEDDLNGIWVGDRTSADNVFYYGCFPGSLLGSTNKETQDVCEKLATLLQETHIEDDLAPPKTDLTISTAAKRHLLNLYFKYHYPFFPVLHKPTIMTQFDQGKLPMLLLNVIFAIAYFYTDEKSYNFFPQLKDKSNEDVAQEFEAQAKKCLDECFSEAEIYTIQALLLMTLYHHRTTVSNNVWLYSGMATRMAMELGLHKDCENLLNGAFEPIEQEIRKKTWWGCFVLDTLYSTMLGRPLSIQQELCDVKLPTLADDEDDPEEIACTNVFIAMSKLGQIVGKLNRLLTSVKLKSNLQDRATRAHDCLVSLKNWFKSLPSSLKKVSDTPPTDIQNIKNCSSEIYLIPFLHSFYHTAVIVGQVLCHTDGHFRITNTNLMGDAVNSATEIVRILTRFDVFYSVHGLSFKFYPLYVSAFLFLHKIKSNQATSAPASKDNNSTDTSKNPPASNDQWYSLFLSCLTTLQKFANTSENGRYSMTVLTGISDHQKVKLPEQFKRSQALISTQNPAHASSHGAQFFPPGLAGNAQALFGLPGGNFDAQALAELAAMGQNGQFNIDLTSAISSLTNQGGNFQNSMMAMNNMSGDHAGANQAPFQAFGQEQFAMGLFRPEDLMNLPTGLTDQYIENIISGGQGANNASISQINELSPNSSSSAPGLASNSPSKPTSSSTAAPQQPQPKANVQSQSTRQATSSADHTSTGSTSAYTSSAQMQQPAAPKAQQQPPTQAQTQQKAQNVQHMYAGGQQPVYSNAQNVSSSIAASQYGSVQPVYSQQQGAYSQQPQVKAQAYSLPQQQAYVQQAVPKQSQPSYSQASYSQAPLQQLHQSHLDNYNQSQQHAPSQQHQSYNQNTVPQQGQLHGQVPMHGQIPAQGQMYVNAAHGYAQQMNPGMAQQLQGQNYSQLQGQGGYMYNPNPMYSNMQQQQQQQTGYQQQYSSAPQVNYQQGYTSNPNQDQQYQSNQGQGQGQYQPPQQ